MVPEIASYFCIKNTVVYDIGASTGNLERVICNTIIERNIDFIPIEPNQSMIDNYYESGSSWKIIKSNVENVKLKKFSFAVSLLGLTFVNRHERPSVIENLKANCMVGGAVLCLEKMVNTDGIIGTLQNRITWKNKIDSGQQIENIVNKELELSGVQFPFSKNELFGFRRIFQYGDFSAFLYIKE
jgi:tRNA (cmo5U34)-methyltransferase